MKEFRQWDWNAELAHASQQLARWAAAEDLDRGYDWTTVALVAEHAQGSADVVTREAGCVAGLACIPVVLEELETGLGWQPVCADGDTCHAGQRLGTLSGPVRDLLTTERILLNLIGHLSGVATLTQAFVRCITPTRAAVYDTRKTHPGYRLLEKYAVRCGGGRNHRTGLFDAILIKDNHLAYCSEAQERHGPPFDPGRAVAIAREFLAQLPHDQPKPQIVEIEVDSLEQLTQVLAYSPDIVLLDNMSPSTLAQAVAMRNQLAPHTQLEASGGVRLDTILEIAQTGVDRISVGAVTHSARTLDVGLDWHPAT